MNTFDNPNTSEGIVANYNEYATPNGSYNKWLSGDHFQFVSRPRSSTMFSSIFSYSNLKCGNGYKFRSGAQVSTGTSYNTTGYGGGFCIFYIKEHQVTEVETNFSRKQDEIQTFTQDDLVPVLKTTLNVGLVESDTYILEGSYVIFSGNRRYEIYIDMNEWFRVHFLQDDNLSALLEVEKHFREVIQLKRGVYSFKLYFRNIQTGNPIYMKNVNLRFFKVK